MQMPFKRQFGRLTTASAWIWREASWLKATVANTAANNARTLDQFEYENGYNNFDVRHTYNASLLYSLPYLFLVIILLVFFSNSILMLFVALGMVQWLTMARIVRGQALSIRRQEFVQAAEALGVTSAGILLRHVVPNLLGRQQEALVKSTKMSIKSMQDACEQYAISHDGQFPQGGRDEVIQLLMNPGADVDGKPISPYLKEVPKDAWQQPLYYEYPNTKVANAVGPAIWSSGPDRKSDDGANDDVDQRQARHHLALHRRRQCQGPDAHPTQDHGRDPQAGTPGVQGCRGQAARRRERRHHAVEERQRDGGAEAAQKRPPGEMLPDHDHGCPACCARATLTGAPGTVLIWNGWLRTIARIIADQR